MPSGKNYPGKVAFEPDCLGSSVQDENLNALFDRSPIYTRVRDDNPTRYIGRSRVKNSMALKIAESVGIGVGNLLD